MKKLLKLYKMFYRLLRLKDRQRRETELHNRSECARIINNIYNEYFAVKTELNDFKKVLELHCIENPYQLLKALESYPIIRDGACRLDFLALEDRLKPQYDYQRIIKQLLRNTCQTGNP